VLPKDDSMSIEATQGLQDGPTEEAPTENHRVTARMVRQPDGTTRTEYTAAGRSYSSLKALKQALRGQP